MFTLKAEKPTSLAVGAIVATNGFRNVVAALATIAHCEAGRFLAQGDNHTAAEWTLTGVTLDRLTDDLRGLD